MADHRNELCFPVHWRVAVFPDPAVKQYFLGETYELSPTSAGIYCPTSFPDKSTILLHLEIPAITKGTRSDELEISAKVVSLSLHSEHGFRIGLQFLEFAEKSGKDLLVQTLTKRFKPGSR